MLDNDSPLINSKVIYKALLQEATYHVATTTVLAGGVTLWHRHTSVYDRFTVVSGVLTVEIKVDDVVTKTEVCDYYVVEPGVSHRVTNETDNDVVYVTVQSGGSRDFVLDPR